MADGIVFKVSTEELNACAEEVQGSLTDMNHRFSSIAEAVNRSNAYWQGEAAEKHRRIYSEMKETIDEIMSRLGEHVTDLRSMAQVYAEGEAQVAELSYDLPSDVLV